MPHPVDPDSLGFVLFDVFRLMRAEIDRRINAAGIGVTPAEARLLAHAARAGEVRQNVLAEKMGVEAMTLSGHLDRLEAVGMIERLTDPGDRRAKIVRLTDAADRALSAIRHIAQASREVALRDLSEAESAALHDMLKRVRSALSAPDATEAAA